MTRRIQALFAVLLLSSTIAWAQTGGISGKLTDATSGETLPFAAVRVIQGGIQKAGVATDIDGNFTVFPLTPGRYDLEFSSLGLQ